MNASRLAAWLWIASLVLGLALLFVPWVDVEVLRVPQYVDLGRVLLLDLVCKFRLSASLWWLQAGWGWFGLQVLALLVGFPVQWQIPRISLSTAIVLLILLSCVVIGLLSLLGPGVGSVCQSVTIRESPPAWFIFALALLSFALAAAAGALAWRERRLQRGAAPGGGKA